MTGAAHFAAKPARINGWRALPIIGFVLWCVFLQALQPLPERGSDFPAFYAAAKAPWTKLYDLDYYRRFQNELRQRWGPHEVQPFPRAPLLAVFLKPFGWFDYKAAVHLWLVTISLATVGCAWLVRKLYGGDWRILLWMITYYPVSLSLSWGQDSPFVLGPLLLALLFHRRGADWAAAFYLSLAFQKFHLLLLVPVLLLLHAKRSLLMKFSLWIGFWGALNVALIGPDGVRDYISMLGAGVVDRLFVRSWNLRSLAFYFGWGKTGYVAGVVLVGAWFIWLARRLRFEAAFWSAVGLSLLLAWHSFKYDYTLAFPLFYVLWREHQVRLAAVLLGGGLWVHAFTMERQTWMLAPLVVASTILLWRRTKTMGVVRHIPPAPHPAEAPAAADRCNGPSGRILKDPSTKVLVSEPLRNFGRMSDSPKSSIT